MRKLLSVLLSIALAISLVGCGTAEDAAKQTTEEKQPIKQTTAEQETTNSNEIREEIFNAAQEAKDVVRKYLDYEMGLQEAYDIAHSTWWNIMIKDEDMTDKERKVYDCIVLLAGAFDMGIDMGDESTYRKFTEENVLKYYTELLVLTNDDYTENETTATEQETTTQQEQPTETPTPAPTEPPTQKPTEPPTPAPTQPPTEPPTEKPTPAPTQPPTEPPTEAKLTNVAPIRTHTFSGSGDDVITGVKVDNISFVRYINTGDRHTDVKAHYGDSYELLVNTSDPYTGDTLLMPSDTDITFEISSKTDWTLEIWEIGACSNDSFSGTSDTVTGLFICTSDIYQIEYSGDSHFHIKGYYDDDIFGTTYDLLVNQSDPYSGKVFFKQKGNYAFFEIVGQGNWSITPVK